MPKKSTSKSLDREKLLAKSANAVMTKSGKNTLNCAPVSSTQITDMLVATKGQQIAKRIATTQKLLTSYAANDVQITKLPAKTREYLTSVAEKSSKNAVKNKRVYKSWPRKNAAILVALLSEKKPRAPRAAKSSPPAPAAPEQPTE
jgi:hypothetical protein